jgi:hypothetical protein
MTDSYAAIAAKPKAVAGAPGSFADIAAKVKNFTWTFLVSSYNPASITVTAFTVDEARQQVLDLLAKIVPLAAKIDEKLQDPNSPWDPKWEQELRAQIPATLRLGCFCPNIFKYSEDFTVLDYGDQEVKLGVLIRNTAPEIHPFHLFTFYSCLDG